jgi:thiopeptide-type bacteriocin biosynthesis protein
MMLSALPDRILANGSIRTRPTAEWASVHLFGRPALYGSDGDAVLLRDVRPLVRTCARAGAIDGFFFVRYGEGGPHIRLRMRLRAARHRATVERLVQDRLHASDRSPRRGATPGGASRRVVRFEWTPYVPELDRYGGPAGVAIAERVFHASSVAAFAMLRAVAEEDRTRRLGLALLNGLVVLHVFMENHTALSAFAATHAMQYAQLGAPGQGLTNQFRATFDANAEARRRDVARILAAAADSALPPAVRRFQAELRDCRDSLRRAWYSRKLSCGESPLRAWSDCVGRIVPSYLHMMNNRLGIVMREEAYLAYVISRATDRDSR